MSPIERAAASSVALSVLIAGSVLPRPCTAGEVSFSTFSNVVETVQTMAAATQRAHPEIKVVPHLYPDYQAYIEDLAKNAARGHIDDVVGLEPGAVTQKYRPLLMPLQDCAARVWGADWKDRFYPIGIQQARMGNPPGDENFYGLPVIDQTINVWYTLPVFEKLGIPPPKTYQEFVSVAGTLKASGFTPLVVAAKEPWMRRDVFTMLMHDIDPDFIEAAEAGKASFADKKVADALTWWKRLFDEGLVQPDALNTTYAQASKLIHDGRAGMFVVGSWWTQETSKKDAPDLAIGLKGYAPMRFPDLAGKGGADDLLGGIDVMVGVAKSAKDPDAACKVATDWVSGAAGQAYIDTFADLPAWKGLNPTSYVSEHQKAVWALLVNDWLPSVRHPRQLEYADLQSTLADILLDVASGTESPEAGAARLEQAAVLARGKP